MNIHDYNSRVDYINNASRQLEKKLCEESIKLHKGLQDDIYGKKAYNSYPPRSESGWEWEWFGLGAGGMRGFLNWARGLLDETVFNISNYKTHSGTIYNEVYSPKHTPNRYYEIHSKEDPYKPVNFWTPALKLVNFEGPTTRSIPLDDGKIGGSITTWQWTKASERHF
uniref:Uncharacterized protein n=1 Tax=Meloidogyne javanica TaxID=6303 RepID=A0A915LHC1_MELJA